MKRAGVVYRCALGLQPREEISIISVRSKVSAGVAYWLGIGSPVRSTEFDSPHSLQAGVAQVEELRLWLQNHERCQHRWRCAEPVIRKSARVARLSVGLSTRSIIERPLVLPQLPGPGFMRASEPVSCWPHKPCEWRSTRQPATNSFRGIPGF